MRSIFLAVNLMVLGCGRLEFGEIPGGPSSDAGDAVAACGSAYVTWAPLTSRYRVGSALDWAVAEADCETDGGHLVVVGDVAERDELRARIPTGNIWIGLSDRITEGTYLDVTGTTPSYTAWSGAQPSNTGEDCVEILLNSYFEDTTCSQTVSAFPYACECDGTPALVGTAF